MCPSLLPMFQAARAFHIYDLYDIYCKIKAIKIYLHLPTKKSLSPCKYPKFHGFLHVFSHIKFSCVADCYFQHVHCFLRFRILISYVRYNAIQIQSSNLPSDGQSHVIVSEPRRANFPSFTPLPLTSLTHTWIKLRFNASSTRFCLWVISLAL